MGRPSHEITRRNQIALQEALKLVTGPAGRPNREMAEENRLSVLWNKGRFCNNSEINTLISKRLSVENNAKPSQLTRADFVTIPQSTH